MTSNDDSATGLDVPGFLQRQPSNVIEILPPERREIVMPDRSARLLEIAGEIRQLHTEVIGGLRQTVPMAIRAGELLIEAKAQVKASGGKWLPWLGQHCSFSEDTAQIYMRLFQHREKIAELLNTEPVRYLTIQAAVKAVSKPRPNKSKPSPRKSDSEKRTQTALKAMHVCEPAERRAVMRSPGLAESIVETGVTLLRAWDAASAEDRATLWNERRKELLAAKTKGTPGRPPKKKPASDTADATSKTKDET